MSRTRRSPSDPTAAASTRPDPRSGGRPTIVARGPADLLAAVPHLLGFCPQRSLVLVSLRGPRSRFGLIARIDLPDAEQVDGGAQQGYASRCVEFVLRDQPTRVAVIVYGTDRWSSARPAWQSLVGDVTDELSEAGVPVLASLYVGPERYGTYGCADPACCPPHGRPVSALSSSQVAATFVVDGSAPLPDRAALEEQVEVGAGDRCAAVERLARAELSRVGPFWCADGDDRWTGWQVESLELLASVARAFEDGASTLSVQTAARLVAGLCDVTTRDAAVIGWTRWELGWQDGAQEQDSPAGGGGALAGLLAAVRSDRPGRDSGERHGRGTGTGPGTAVDVDSTDVDVDSTDVDVDSTDVDVDSTAVDVDSAAVDVDSPGTLPGRQQSLAAMWRGLATSCEGTLAVAPLVLLAMHEWSSGHGAQASAAVQRALRLDRDYRMARLMDRVLALGLAPAWVGSQGDDPGPRRLNR